VGYTLAGTSPKSPSRNLGGAAASAGIPRSPARSSSETRDPRGFWRAQGDGGIASGSQFA